MLSSSVKIVSDGLAVSDSGRTFRDGVAAGVQTCEPLVEFPGIKNRGIKKCKAKDNQIIMHFSSVPLF